MKKNLFSAIAICLSLTMAYAQGPKKPQLVDGSSIAARNANNPADVSAKSMIRFNTDITTPEQRAQLDQERLNTLTAANPHYAKDRNDYEEQIQTLIAHNPGKYENNQMVITIPVVVHVVYKTTAQNIPDNQVFSQIQVLNEDFGRTNSDANTHWSQAVNTTIQFCLAQQTPTGAATNGIERTSTTVTSFSSNDNVKHSNTGGANIWDPTRYLNIWVCNLGAGLLGYGEFPTGSTTTTFGVVILYSAFGSNYTSYGSFSAVAAPYDRGRTTTHEFSHCFNLFHIWGDDGGSCAGNDQCADTPNQADATTTCFTFPHTDACTGTGNGIMFENYMDYSYDNCLNLFTNGQKTRMLAVLNSTPYNALQTSNGCVSPVTVNNDAGITAIATPNGSYCVTTFTPVVTLKNWGSNALTSCTINYKIDNNAVQTFSWTGNLAAGATTSVTLNSMTTTAATHTFTCYTSNPNATTDGQTSNDQSTSTFTCLSGTGQNLPFSDGIESTTFPANGSTLTNPDASTTWARTTAAAKTGVASMFMDDFNYNASGQHDYFTLPGLNLASVSNPTMTFQVAYRLYTNPTSNPNYSDSLRVEISTDCGATWTSLYFKYGTTLTTATPTYSTTLFVPTASQWRLETIALTSYASATNAMIRFNHSCNFENQMYVDDINIMGSTGIEMTDLANNVNLFPNPSNTGNFTLNIGLSAEENLNISITDAVGRVVKTIDEGKTMGGLYNLDLTNESNGVYFVTITAGDQKLVQRIVINR